MGVRNYDVYPEVKRLLGIPVEEPIFILRAQDVAAMETLASYAKIAKLDGASEEFLLGIVDVNTAFGMWRNDNRDSVKIPD